MIKILKNYHHQIFKWNLAVLRERERENRKEKREGKKDEVGKEERKTDAEADPLLICGPTTADLKKASEDSLVVALMTFLLGKKGARISF